MGRFFSDEIIEEVRARNDIVEVVSQYVSLRKAGRNYVGLCPFHSERDPSFTVSPDKQMFYCFGCQTGGNVFTFLMKVEGYDFPEAVEVLASRAGVPLPARSEEGTSRRKRSDQLLRVLEMAADQYHRMLMSRAGTDALDYLRQRGLPETTIKEFRLGYAPQRWDYLTRHMARRGVDVQVLVDAGLAVRRERGGGAYDRFRHRILFPIQDHRGRVVGFGGRALKADDQPKYLNSPETAVFSKGRIWYALPQAREEMRRLDWAVVVEGYMDALAMHGAGIRNVVASLGTALGAEQARALSRLVNEVVVAYDADSAGQRASLRALEAFWEVGVSVRVAVMPEGWDPDDFLRARGPAALRQVLAEALPLVDYHLYLVSRQFDLSSVAGKVAASRELCEVLARVENAVERDAYIARVAHRLGVNEGALREEVARRRRTGHKGWQNRDNTKDAGSGLKLVGGTPPAVVRAERDLLRLLLCGQSCDPEVLERLERIPFSDPCARSLLGAVLRCLRAGVEPDVQRVAADIEDPEVQALLGQLAVAAGDDEESAGTLEDYISLIEKHQRERRLAELLERIREQERSGRGVTPELLREYDRLRRAMEGSGTRWPYTYPPR